MDVFLTAATALLAAVIGGWVGSATQFSAQRRLRSLDLLWDFRLQLHKARQAVWDPKGWPDLQERIHWLRVAASDPRLGLDLTAVNEFATALENAHMDLTELELEEGRVDYTIPPESLETVDTALKAVDALAIDRLGKLA